MIVCVAEPNVEELLSTETTQTREGKGKFEMTLAIILIIHIYVFVILSFSPTSLPSDQISCKLKGNFPKIYRVSHVEMCDCKWF